MLNTAARLAASCLVLAALALPFGARADIPPEDACSNEGARCNNAPGPGVCRKSQCSRVTPNGMVSYECLRCTAEPVTPPKKKHGCAVGSAPAEGAGLALAIAAPLALVARRRRRAA